MYMSYEQLLGEDDIDGRADVYAFGVVLYEALTGRPPYEARSHAEWVLHFAVPPPSPKTHRAEIPTSLDRLVMWCLESDRNKRVPSMEALIRELEPFATELSFRNLLTVPSQASVLLSSLGPTPAEAVAALLERIQAGNTPKPAAATPTPAGPAARAREQRASSLGAGLTDDPAVIPGRSKRAWVLAVGAGLLLLFAWLNWLRGDAQVAEQEVETTVNSAKTPPIDSAPHPVAAEPARPKAGAVAAPNTHQPTDPAIAVPRGVSEPQRAEPRPTQPSAPAQRVSPQQAAPTHVPPPSAAPERHVKPGTDWGIY
jgi:serine/threonine-protein kinase